MLAPQAVTSVQLQSRNSPVTVPPSTHSDLTSSAREGELPELPLKPPLPPGRQLQSSFSPVTVQFQSSFSPPGGRQDTRRAAKTPALAAAARKELEGLEVGGVTTKQLQGLE